MNKPIKPKKRLTRSCWQEVALELLKKDGINAVTVDALAAQLGITRGSFYHHFKDRNDLAREMLAYWKQKWTVELRDDVDALGLDGLQSLIALANLITHRKASGYDTAVRAWAIHDEMAREVVKESDKIRLNFIRKQFAKIGFKDLDLENRSRLFLYYAMTEPAFFNLPDKREMQELDQVRLKFLTTP
jgi:AcrR family transcriptional regulator